ncbi:MAG: glycosyltransferase family 2 protein [Planctomycetes bacterium]|nr:glycosyltransferase family 2 protein [Planctomycetota bacterium]
MDVSIIIVAWNVRELLFNCLKSVFDVTRGISFEVIYVDNSSEDGSIEMVSEEFPDVRIIRNKKNEGFIKANNQGIEISQGRYVLLLNSDTVVLDNAIAKMVKFADAHPETAVIGCKVLNPDETLQRNCFMQPSLLNMFLSATYLYKIFPKNRFMGRERMTWWDFDKTREVETISGCFSLVRREAIEQVGVMNDIYFVYGDDPDWCYRFKKSGWKVLFNPEPKIIHYGGQNTKHMAEKFKLQLYGSKLIFMKLHRSKLKFPLARFFTAMFFLWRVPYWLATAMLDKNERKKSIQTAKSYLVGGFYCLTDWKKLLMNKEVLEGRL